MINTPDEEPVAGPWSVVTMGVLFEFLAAKAISDGRRGIIAVDGRSGSGKSTFVSHILRHVNGSAVVHSDDVAWHESFFDWADLMVDGILRPVRERRSIRFRPPAWDRRQRRGAIEVPSGDGIVVVEGVGVARRSLTSWYGATVWIQSDRDEARRRGIERDGGTAADVAFWAEWDRHEMPFLASDRPWERADVIVCGTPDLTGLIHDPLSEVVIGTVLPS